MSAFINSRTNSDSFLYQPPSSPIHPIDEVLKEDKTSKNCDYIVTTKSSEEEILKRRSSLNNSIKSTIKIDETPKKRTVMEGTPIQQSKPKPQKIYRPSLSTHNHSEALKKAKAQYEKLTDLYYQQLTIGCQQVDCKNRFCASGKCGIVSLQPQAAMIMSIQLASMSDSKLCIQPNDTNPKRTQPTEPESSKTRPFLQSLLATRSFSSLTHQPDPPLGFWKSIFSEPSYYQLDDFLEIKPSRLQLESGLEQLRQVQPDTADAWCRSIFQHWDGIGQSFGSLDEVGQFCLAVLDRPRSLRLAESISDSFEIVLDRMMLNLEVSSVAWCRSVLCVVEWMRCLKARSEDERFGMISFDHKQWCVGYPVILIQKWVQVLSKVAQKKDSKVKRMIQAMFSTLDSNRLEFIVKDLQSYLTDHFHTGPYKQGLEDTVVMILKCLELIYESNMKNPNMPIISPSLFYNPEICKKLNIKREYRIWKRVLVHGEGRHNLSNIVTEYQRKSRICMTAVKTYPFIEHEFQFSWFSYAFLLPPEMKRKVILIDTMSQMAVEYEDACVNHTLVIHAHKLLSGTPHVLDKIKPETDRVSCPYLLLSIRRSHVVPDTLRQLSARWADLKKPLKVKFVDEVGVDQGGVQKEFFRVLFEKLASAELGLFCQDDQTRLCWIRPVQPSRLYEMVGVMMGLSIYNGVMINLQFPSVFWKIMVRSSEASVDLAASAKELFTLEDLEEGWPSLGHGLRQLLEYNHEDLEDVFCRDYEITMDLFGQGVVNIPLMDEPIEPVSLKNKERYVQDYCTYFMYTSQRDELLAIRRGLWSVIGSRALSLCTAEELEMVACGLRQGSEALQLDLTELENVTKYDDGYSENHPTIRQFWSIVHEDLTNDQKKELLLFVTSSDRIPVGGLKELTFYIQRNGPDSNRLPTALTCFSRLLLPEYSTREKLRDRLVTAIENTKGFGLI